MDPEKNSVNTVNKKEKLSFEGKKVFNGRLLLTSLIKVFIFLCIIILIFVFISFQTALNQVSIVEVSGKSPDFQVIEIK